MLFVALILLLILTLLGVVLARMQTVEERLSANDQNHSLAVQAAEAALRYVENNINNYPTTPYTSNTAGMYQFDPVAQPNAYLTTVNGTNPWVTNGATLSYPFAGTTVGVAQAPQYMIENLPPVAPPCESSSLKEYGRSTPPAQVLRITSRSVGGDANGAAEIQMGISGTCS